VKDPDLRRLTAARLVKPRRRNLSERLAGSLHGSLPGAAMPQCVVPVVGALVTVRSRVQ
jgi:hypothetical protein